MARPAKEKINFILIILVSLFLAQCANQLPPGGGDIDRTPPEIVEIYPADGTINFEDDYFELEFSEYVDKRTLREAIFISPALEGNIELDWSGKTVRVEFPEKLRENTTYNITIGTDVADLNNRNKMAEALNFSFSTGNQIDRRMITGKIHSEKPQGVLLFAYINPEDTLNPSTKKPDYISQSGSDGSYKIPGLAAGVYRIFAVEDEFRDLLFQAEQDKIGVPFKEVTLSETDTLFTGLDFFIFMADTMKPRMLTSVMTDRHHIVLTMSEELVNSSVSSENFYLYDSTLKAAVKPLYVYRNFNKPVEVILAIEDTLSEGNLVYVFADSLQDQNGNVYLKENNSITVSAREDTLDPFISRTLPPSGTATADYQNQEFSFSFNDGIDSIALKRNTSFTDTSGRKIRFNILFSDDANFRIYPTERLEPSKDYLINFNLKNISDAAGNNKDTTFVYRFKTISGLDFTGLSGRVDSINFQRNPVLVLQGINEKKITYEQRVSVNKFNFERIEPGTYRLWGYYDTDSSSNYTLGWPYPIKYSEEFSYYPDSLSLRPRWAITDVNFNFGKGANKSNQE